MNIKKIIRGKQIVGEGKKRIVFDLNNGYILKLAKTKEGVISNKNEVLIYNSSPFYVRKHIGRIISHGKGKHWLIMRKQKWNFPKSKKYARKLFKMNHKFKKLGLITEDIYFAGKPNYQNLRLNRKGSIIVIDYGEFKYRRKSH